MNQRMEKYDLYRPVITINSLREEVKSFRRVGTVHAALSVTTGSTVEQNQVLRVSSTHRGLTQDDVRTGDKLGEYVVDYVITGPRYTQLFLTKEAAL